MNLESKTYRSNGKLLITGEYVVLDGAKALAIPTYYGQDLLVSQNDTDALHWKSLDESGQIWFKGFFKTENDTVIKDTSTALSMAKDNAISDRLIQILNAVIELNPEFLEQLSGISITTNLDFNRQWGLGTSSTLINNIAQWAQVNPYSLLEKTFGGSGYDIACAQHDTPISYQIKNSSPQVELVDFNPTFSNQLYFVYLNQKQNSRSGIAKYKTLGKVNPKVIERLTQITEAFMSCDSLQLFQDLMVEHETLISSLIDQPPIQKRLFSDFNGTIKSLGAWGGDFVLIASSEHPEAYFLEKGFDTIIPYTKMIKPF